MELGLLAAIGLVVLLVLVRGGGRVSSAGAYVCATCGTRGSPSKSAKGSLFIEIVLWLCFIIPGLIYSLWRISNRAASCPVCGAHMIPVASPRGRELIRNR